MPIPLPKPVSEIAKRGREEQGDTALRTSPVNVQTTNEARNSNIVYFQGDCFPFISISQFKAGRLKDFAHNWGKLTSNAFILDTVQHCHIEFKQGSHVTSIV